MRKNDFIGVKLLVQTLQTVESGVNLGLLSVWEGTSEGEDVLITAPIYKGTIYPISLKETLYVHFFTENGRFDFTCEVLERPVINNIYFLKVRLTSEINQSQRRSHFRVRKAMRAKAIIEGKLIVDASTHPQTKHIDGLKGIVASDCLTYDISASGLSLYMTHTCDIADMVLVSLPIGVNDSMANFMTQVMWVKECEKANYTHLVGLKFSYDNKNEEERMVKHVFLLQYEMIRKQSSLT